MLPSCTCVFVSATHMHSFIQGQCSGRRRRGFCKCTPNEIGLSLSGSLCAHNAPLVFRHRKKDDGKISLEIGVWGRMLTAKQWEKEEEEEESAVFH